MYSFPNLEPVHFSMSSSNCCFLTCMQVSQEAGKLVWYSHLLKNFPICCDPHSQRIFHSQWSKSRYFSGILLLFVWSSGCWQIDLCSSAFSKSSLNIWKFLVHILLKPNFENFEHYFASMWNECNYAVVWAFEFFAIAFFGTGMKLTFSSPEATAEFSKFAGILNVALSQHHLLVFEIAQLEFHPLH